MKINNRLGAMLLAAALMVTATACDSAPASESSSPSSEPSSSSTPASSSSAALVAPEREYIKGVTTDNEYVSEFWGLKFAPPDKNITLATPEQLSALLGFGADAMDTDPALAEQLESQMGLYEMAAIDMTTGSMLMLMSAELPMSGMSAELYIKGILESVKASGSNIVIELDNDGNSFKETVAGKEFTCISYTMKGTENIPDNYQTQRILVDGKRALIVSTTYPPAIETAKARQESLLAALTAVEQ